MTETLELSNIIANRALYHAIKKIRCSRDLERHISEENRDYDNGFRDGLTYAVCLISEEVDYLQREEIKEKLNQKYGVTSAYFGGITHAKDPNAE